MLASWMNNQRLIRNVGDHLALYHQLTGTPVAPKLRAQQRLRADGALLDDWQRRGATALSPGLYQGLRLVPAVEAAVNDWAPPPPPRRSLRKSFRVRKHSSRQHVAVRLRAIRAESRLHQMLVNSLVGIKAKPGWLIVVVRHTDNTGTRN
jgi:hypothetical protein